MRSGKTSASIPDTILLVADGLRGVAGHIPKPETGARNRTNLSPVARRPGGDGSPGVKHPGLNASARRQIR